MISSIIFDGEGVVIDTEPSWDHADRMFLRRKGFVYDREAVKPLISGRSLLEGTRVLKDKFGLRGSAASLARERLKLIDRCIGSEVRYIPGFLGFFRRVRGSFKTCVATGMDEHLLRAVESQLRLRRLFASRIYTPAQVGFQSKPNPAIFLYAAKRLHSNPKECLVIEDSPMGIEAARRADMLCYGLATTYEPKLLGSADEVFESFPEMLNDVLQQGGPRQRSHSSRLSRPRGRAARSERTGEARL